jgi:hypothetical protein
MKRFAATVGIVMTIAIIYLFFFTQWLEDFGRPGQGYGMVILNGLRDKMSFESLLYMLLPISAFILIFQLFWDAFIGEQSRWLMRLFALLVLIPPVYFLVDFLLIPEFEVELGISKWDFLLQAFWFTLVLSIATFIYTLGYAYLDWKEAQEETS